MIVPTRIPGKKKSSKAVLAPLQNGQHQQRSQYGIHSLSLCTVLSDIFHIKQMKYTTWLFSSYVVYICYKWNISDSTVPLNKFKKSSDTKDPPPLVISTLQQVFDDIFWLNLFWMIKKIHFMKYLMNNQQPMSWEV